MSSLVTLRGIRKEFGSVTALHDVNLDVRQGEWVSITGVSGSGKSTLLNIISCLEQPTAGQFLLDGVDVTRLPEEEMDVIRREKVGLVFQQFHLIPHLTAMENVMLAQYYHSMTDMGEARRSLERVGLGHRVSASPHQLSGGEKQRLCIARALINYPALILADEPTGNLDVGNQETVMELFRDLHRQGHTLIIVTHDPKVAGEAQRQLVLEHGRLRVKAA